MALKIYDSNEVSIVLMGIPVDSGFAEDSMVEIDIPAGFVTKEGLDGEVTRSKTNSKLCKIKLSLMQSSSVNDALSALYAADLDATNGAGVGPTTVADRGGTSLYVFAKSWVSKPPSPKFGKAAEVREWEIEGVVTFQFTGGN